MIRQGIASSVLRFSGNPRLSGVMVPSTAAMIAARAASTMAVNPFQTIPTEIFNDPSLVRELRQDCTSIRKAMRSSKKLVQQGESTMIGSSPDLLSFNQMVRSIHSKEQSCNHIISLVGDYCLGQVVKRQNFSAEADYLEALKVHHRATQAATKVKESMDENDCIVLEHAVEDLANMYTK